MEAMQNVELKMVRNSGSWIELAEDELFGS
jgi:hypothetical protein